MSDSTPTVVRLKSPFTSDTLLMEFRPGVPPTLDTMLLAGFEVVDEEQPRARVKPKLREESRVTAG